MEEVWKDIKWFEGLYKVSNLGNVMSLRRNKLMAPSYINNYPSVGLSYNGIIENFRIHRLVAEAFISHTDDKNVVNHIDGTRTNNNVDNLEWCTQEENIQHALKTGLIKRKPIIQLDKEGTIIATYDGAEVVTRLYGFRKPNICNCCNGKLKQAYGFKWEYAK